METKYATCTATENENIYAVHRTNFSTKEEADAEIAQSLKYTRRLNITLVAIEYTPKELQGGWIIKNDKQSANSDSPTER